MSNHFSRRKILSKAFNSHMDCYIDKNYFFVSIEVSGGYYNSSHFSLINEFQKCRTFMESLKANFIQFSSAIAKFLYLQGKLGISLCAHSVLISR